MAVNYAQLKTEINTDPTALGYAPFRNGANDSALAGLLNNIIVGNKVNSLAITADVFAGLIAQTDYIALTTARQSWLNFIMFSPTIDLNNATILAGLNVLFPSGASRTNIAATQQRDGSRAEKLFGAGTVITLFDIAAAR